MNLEQPNSNAANPKLTCEACSPDIPGLNMGLGFRVIQGSGLPCHNFRQRRVAGLGFSVTPKP